MYTLLYNNLPILLYEYNGIDYSAVYEYNYYINKFLDFVCVPPIRVNVFHIRRYLDDCKARGNSDRTLDNIRSDLSAFFKWLYREDIIQNNPMKKIAKMLSCKNSCL